MHVQKNILRSWFLGVSEYSDDSLIFLNRANMKYRVHYYSFEFLTDFNDTNYVYLEGFWLYKYETLFKIN